MKNIGNHNNRIYGLDIVRAFAILTVVYAHGVTLLPEIFWYKLNLFSYDGVTIFFVLSGFLIGGIIIRTIESKGLNRASLSNFMFKRWSRTLPAYYLVLGTIIFYYSIGEGMSFPEAWKYVLFIQNFNTPHPTLFPEAWSLAVEEWYYILLPLIVFSLIIIAKINPKHSVLFFIIIVVVIATTARYYKSQIGFTGPSIDWNGDVMIRKQVITRLDSIGFGLLGAYISFYYNQIWLRYRRIAFALGLLLFFSERYSFYFIDTFGGSLGIYANVLSYTLLSIGVLLVLPLLSNYKHGGGIIYKLVTYISFISYSMYLVNYVIVIHLAIPFSMDHFPLQLRGWQLPYVRYALFWVYTFTIASVLYYCFEKPILKMRNNYYIVKELN